MNRDRAKKDKPATVTDTPVAKRIDGQVTFSGMSVEIVARKGQPTGDAQEAYVARNAALARETALEMFALSEPPTVADGGEKVEQVLAFAGALPSGSAKFRTGIAEQIASGPNACFVQTAVDAMKPRDAFETMLFAQMARVHAAMLDMSGRMMAADWLPQMQFAEGAMNRLARTYASQMEALRKHRSKGTQTVRHVHVNQGGQAVVADTFNNVREGGGGDE